MFPLLHRHAFSHLVHIGQVAAKEGDGARIEGAEIILGGMAGIDGEVVAISLVRAHILVAPSDVETHLASRQRE